MYVGPAICWLSSYVSSVVLDSVCGDGCMEPFAIYGGRVFRKQSISCFCCKLVVLSVRVAGVVPPQYCVCVCECVHVHMCVCDVIGVRVRCERGLIGRPQAQH